ncbi:MAG TPA: transglycosylase SLT domain-containing protein [Streptosporangiaceae bacterium]|nr:transglycosylase SLT domain-containing protein [Streptosporangiaceae bacterium]
MRAREPGGAGLIVALLLLAVWWAQSQGLVQLAVAAPARPVATTTTTSPVSRIRDTATPPPAPAWRGSCAALPSSTIHTFARRAGFTADQATTAVAVARAESGGRPCAHNPVPPDDSYGLWQINMLGQLGPDRRAALGLRSNRDLYDPAVNARAAFRISAGGRDWSPWTTFTRGTFRAFLGGGR